MFVAHEEEQINMNRDLLAGFWGLRHQDFGIGGVLVCSSCRIDPSHLGGLWTVL